MIYTIIVFALLSVGFVFLIKPQKDNTLTMKKFFILINHLPIVHTLDSKLFKAVTIKFSGLLLLVYQLKKFIP